MSICRLFFSAAAVLWLAVLPASPQLGLFRPAAAIAQAPPDPAVTCRACLVVQEGGRRLWARAASVPRPNASTTKMVTALLVRRALPLDAPVTVSSNAAATAGGGLALSAGDLYAAEDLLYALLLSSSNDAAVALAEAVAGDHASFVERMNRAVRRWGARATTFVTAHGLDAAGHASSARDLALIGFRTLADPALARIVATPAATIEGPSGSFLVENRNVLLETYRGAIGIKTGYTAGAGNVLVAAARRNGTTLVAVAMGSADAAADAATLLDYGWAKLARTVLVEKDVPVGSILFGSAGSIPVLAGRTIRGAQDPADLELALSVRATLPIRRGQTVGSLELVSGGRTVAQVTAVAGASVRSTSESWGADALAGVLRITAGLMGRG